MSTSETTKQIWQLFDEIRCQGERPSTMQVLKLAQERGITIGIDEFPIVSNYFSNRYDSDNVCLPNYVIAFLQDYLKQAQPRTILDPFARTGHLLNSLVSNHTFEKAVGCCRSPQDYEVAQFIDKNSNIEWHLGSSEGEQNGLYDLVISQLPMGLRTVEKTHQHNGVEFDLRDNEEHHWILENALQLSPSGQGIYMVNNQFFFKNENLIRGLNQFGLHLNAVISLPSGTLSPLTSIPVNFIWISRVETPNLFVARLSETTDSKVVVENLRNHQKGKSKEQGVLVASKDFTSWDHLIFQEEMQLLIRKSGCEKIEIADIAEDIKMGRPNVEDGGFEEISNCIYVPLIGKSDVVSNISQLTLKPHNYAQIAIRDSNISPDYLTNFFNTETGKKIRTQFTTGYIPKLNKVNLSKVYILAPSAPTQQQVLETSKQIQDLRFLLDTLEKRLWESPAAAPKIKEELDSINQVDSLNTWIETLPFPLASILKRYDATKDIRTQEEHLFHFFEASTQFFATIILSAYKSNPTIWQEQKESLSKGNGINFASFKTASFGNWLVLYEALAKNTRTMLSNNETKNLCLELFRVNDSALIERITSKQLVSALRVANSCRNKWKGHGGVVTNQVLQERQPQLQSLLSDIRSSIGTCFEKWLLVQPGVSEYLGDIYEYTAIKLSGSNTIFDEIHINTSQPMMKNKLHLIENHTINPLPLIPLFKMQASPQSEKNACYFYNRVEQNGLRWVSYHYAEQAEITEPDSDVAAFFADLEEGM